MTAWRWGVILSALLSVAELAVLTLRTRAFGSKPVYSSPQGSARRGIVYAFGRGMLPGEKESIRLHRLSSLAGILYHAGIFCGFAVLAVLVAGLRLPSPALNVLRAGMGIGLVSGLGLLLRRMARPNLRRLSRPDDFAANGLVDLFLAAALAASLTARAAVVLWAVSILLLLYIPAGKIRHCLFYFYSRVLFGSFFGHRGVLPPRAKGAER